MASKLDTPTAEHIIRTAAAALPRQKRNAVERSLQDGEDPDLISEQDAARMLGMSRSHLWRWRNGELHEPFPFSTLTVPGTHQVRYNRNEVRDYIVSHLTPAHEEEYQAS